MGHAVSRAGGPGPVRAALVISLFLLGCSGCSHHDKEEARRVVTVAAAADLRFAFEEIVKEFRKAQPDIEVRVTYGSSGNFFAQLNNRAPFDVFFSADVGFPRRLAESGLATRDGAFSYAIGYLVIWAPADSPIEVEKKGLQSLLDPTVKKIAIANPEHAPYGRAAVAAVRSLKLYDQLRDKLVPGENVAQAAQYIQSGNAEIGIIPLSLALAPGYREGKRFPIPEKAHPPLEQGGVILSWAREKKAAEALCAFVRGAEGKAILRRFGFTLPKD